MIFTLRSSSFRQIFTLLVILLITSFEIRAQPPGTNQVSFGSNAARECAIAIKPDGTGSNFVAAYYDVALQNIRTTIGSATTSGGISWSSSPTTMSKSPDGTTYDELVDEKIAYRVDGSNKELLMVYRAARASTQTPPEPVGDEGAFLSFSTDNGGTWSTNSSTPSNVSLQTNLDGSGLSTRRPIIATDPSSNNAYIAWTTNSFTPGTNNVINVCVVAGGSHSKSHQQTLSTTGSSTTEVDVCDIAVSRANGTVYLLWRETNLTTNKRSLFLASSTNAGVTWTTTATTIGSSTDKPASVTTLGYTLEYQDYPCMTISTTDCSSEKVFVAFTAKPASTSTNGQSDLYLLKSIIPTSGSWSWVSGTTNSIDGWIDADNVVPFGSSIGDNNNVAYKFQFEPQMSADGQDGVFLLYYSSQTSGSTKYPCAVLYETGDHGPQRVLSSPSPSGTHDVTDYVGIVWNADKYLANAVWTDYPGSSAVQTIYSKNINGSPLQSTVSNPDLGYLNSSNQRRIVMTGNTAHLVTFDNPNALSDHGVSVPIWYSEQTANTDGTASNWMTPIRLDNNDTRMMYGTPSVGVYEKGDNTAQRAIAVVWAEQDVSDQSYFAQVYTPIFVRIKEFNHCEAGDISDWSPIYSIATLANASHSQVPMNVTVAPLTAPVTGSGSSASAARYLLGWVVTWTQAGVLMSKTILRGGQLTSNAVTQNQNWRTQYGSFTQAPPNSTDFNVLVQDVLPSKRLVDNSFVTVTSNESNWNGKVSHKDDATQEVAFTGDGTISFSGAWVCNATYVTTPTSTHGTLGSNLGELSIITSPLLISAPSPKPDISGVTFSTLSLDRNPSITITSTGQKLATWEHMDGPLGSVSAVTVGGTAGTPCLPVLNYASIRMAQTNSTGGWALIKDKISGSANDATFHWLLNPSITSFPKTTLSNATGTSDQDPGAAELLYWQKNKVNISGCTYSVTQPDALHERHFFEQKGLDPLLFPGVWNSIDPVGGNPAWPSDGISGIPGSSSQRSFGVFNTGPQYHPISSDNKLYRDAAPATDPYNNGLSYGIGNEVVSGTPNKKIAAATADVGAFKGTFDTALGVDLYRCEMRMKDSGIVEFKWGKVYVEDTDLSVPIREVMFHNGIPDTSGFASHSAMRDSIFSTEWFNWPVSAQIKYHRLMLAPVRGYFLPTIDTIAIDTLNAYDTTQVDSAIAFDTIPVFHADSVYRDGSFYASGLHMKYTVELVHLNGHIDTVEQMVFDPYDSLFIEPMTVHIANAGSSADTVMLRVLGDFAGIPDADTNVEFDRETMLDQYPNYGDTTVAIGTGGGLVAPSGGSCFSAIGPYPNPSGHSGQSVSILAHFCALGVAIVAQVYDVIGNPVGSAVTLAADGQTWDRLAIPAPSTPGTYFIHVSAGGYSTILGYSVY